MKYTLYIDESGDLGLDKIRTDQTSRGASPFLVLGACLIPESSKANLINLHDRLASEFSVKALHCAELNHFQISKFAREVGQVKNILTFAFISMKETLGDYKKSISGERQAQKYYNKCAQYLLERVGEAANHYGIDKDDITFLFETRRGHDYGSLRAFIRKVRETPLDERSALHLSAISPMAISDRSKEKDKLFSFADLVAYAAFQSVNFSKKNCGLGEQRYLREIMEKFFKSPENGAVGDYGIKLIKMHDMDFDKKTLDFFTKLHKK